MSTAGTASPSSSPPAAERRFKIVVLGTTGVGKTCITLRFVRGVYEDDQLPTIGAAFMTAKKRGFVYEIWDTAGQERYQSITPLYYRHAQAAILAFDVHDKGSFVKAKEWLTQLRKELNQPDMPVALAANKMDLEGGGAGGGVDLEEVEAFANENHLKVFKTSAKTGLGVEEMFTWLADTLPAAPAPAAVPGTSQGAGPGAGRPIQGLGEAAPRTQESCC